MKCRNYYRKKAFAFFLFASLLISVRPRQGDEFNYDEKSGMGPSCWGSLKKEWETCGTGKLQSPIDIPLGSTTHPTLGDLERTYASRPAVLKNRGHDIAVLWNNGDAGKININGSDYQLIQCHWHSPSEHTFEGTRHPLEIHIVHQNAQKQIAVVSMAFQIGRADPFLSTLLPSIKCVKSAEAEKVLGNVNPLDIGFVGRKYYRYTGSLTTPPCTQGVVWTVFKKVKTASMEQIRALKDTLAKEFKENSRPTQSLCGRPVLFYDPAGNTALCL